MTMKAIVWSNVGCHFCEKAKTLLTQKGIFAINPQEQILYFTFFFNIRGSDCKFFSLL